MFLLDALYLLVATLLSPLWLLMLVVKPSYRAGIADRFTLRAANVPFPKSIWLHGSSAGEIELLRPLVKKFEGQLAGYNIVVSAFSISGYAAAKKLYPQYCVIYFPIDLSPVIKQFLRLLNPVLIILVESEFWPNFIATASKSGIPICLLNGRMSDKSFRMHKRTRLIPWALKKVSLFAVQTEEDASRFCQLGIAGSRLNVTGNMKYDLQDGSDLPDRLRLRHNLRAHYVLKDDMPVLVGGSIHRGEDLALASAYSRLVKEGYRLRMVMVPRYPAEATVVGLVLEEQGLTPLLKEQLAPDERDIFSDPRRVLVVDTIGELKQFYALADIAYVGGSLIYRGSNKGGHNLMEPAILGLAVMFGPHNYSFRETVRDLLDSAAGLVVRDQDEIFSGLKRFLEEPAFAVELGAKARQVILKNRGAADKNFRLLSKFPPFVRN